MKHCTGNNQSPKPLKKNGDPGNGCVPKREGTPLKMANVLWPPLSTVLKGRQLQMGDPCLMGLHFQLASKEGFPIAGSPCGRSLAVQNGYIRQSAFLNPKKGTHIKEPLRNPRISDRQGTAQSTSSISVPKKGVSLKLDTPKYVLC